MNESTVCPQCHGCAVLKRFSVHRQTGAILDGKRLILWAIGLFVLAWVVGLSALAVGERAELIGIGVAGAYLWGGGIIASIVIVVRLLRSPEADWLECTSCGHHWKAEAQEMARLRDEAEAQEIKRMRGAVEGPAGSVVIPYDMLPAGTYTEDDLGLKPLDSCIYCGKPAKPLLRTFGDQRKDKEGKESGFALKLNLPYCEVHARVNRRNTAIYYAGFVIGGVLGIVLLVLSLSTGPDGGPLTSIMEWLLRLLPELYAWIIVLVLMAGFVSGVTALTALIVRLAGSAVFPSMRDQRLNGMLGVSHTMDDANRILTLCYTRAQTAIDYKEPNQEVLQNLAGAAVEKKMAQDAVQAQVRAEAAAAEAQRLQAEAEASRPTEVVALEQAQAKLVSQSSVCWFCEKDRPADGSPHDVVLFKMEGEARQEETVWVARCASCDRVHSTKVSSVTAVLVILLSSAPCLLIGLLFGTDDKLKGLAWVIGAVISLVVFLGARVLIRTSFERRAADAGTRVDEVAYAEHPEVKALVNQGWQVDKQKSGTAAGKAQGGVADPSP